MRNRCAEPMLAGWSCIREQALAWEEFLPGKHPRLAHKISWFKKTCWLCVFTRSPYHAPFFSRDTFCKCRILQHIGRGVSGIESACQFDPSFWPVQCKLNIGAVLWDGLTGGNVLITELILTSSCLFWRVQMIFFWYTFQTVVHWQYCHVFQPCRFVSVSVLSLCIFCCCSTLNLEPQNYCTACSMLQQNNPNHYIFYFIAPKFAMKSACIGVFLVQPCVCLAYFFPAWRIHTILLCCGYLNVRVCG